MRTSIAALAIAADLLMLAPAGAATVARAEERSSEASASRLTPPLLIVAVYVAPGIPASTVARMLAETDDVWRPNGLTFVWQRAPAEAAPYGRAGEAGRYRPSTLRVQIDTERGQRAAEGQTTLCWIGFDRPDEPDQEIHVSYANAESLLEASQLVVGHVGTMPALQRELYVARAMGRALAHELGHYLLASKAHTPRGLMQTNRSAAELFGRQRVRFDLDAIQKQEAMSRLTQSLMLSRR
jgi:hypothetical protein